MQELQEFMAVLTGQFDNTAQYEEMKRDGGAELPFAQHRNTVCNGKLLHLPEGFPGIFMVEESYYTIGERTNASAHLFLFTEEKEGILLTSYEIPQGCDKRTFSYAGMPETEYEALQKSEKFTPALYVKKGDAWEGGSVSMFSPVMKFTLWERFSQEKLEVSESIEVNGKRTFGYDSPIIYRRVTSL